MINKKNRFIVIIVGFFLLIIPIIFFIYNLKSLLDFSKERTKETLRQQLLNQAQKIEESLNPFNYIKNEFTKIHTELLPDFPDEVIEDKRIAKQLRRSMKRQFGADIIHSFYSLLSFFSDVLDAS